jgi:hypothetical protein
MLDRLRKIVLALMALMVLLSPFMQMDSWDNFPVSTDDIELQLIFGLCLIGMFLVFVGVAKLLPELMLSTFVRAAKAVDQVDFDSSQPEAGLFVFSPPLRT